MAKVALITGVTGQDGANTGYFNIHLWCKKYTFFYHGSYLGRTPVISIISFVKYCKQEKWMRENRKRITHVISF